MVKGITRQVIVVKGPGQKLFEQAIFLVREEALADGGVTEDALLQEARNACQQGDRASIWRSRLLWAGSGAAATGIAWLLSVLL